MPRFVGLLRGVNVGKGRRVPMADLRRLLTGHGYGDVRTLLNSGNVVVDSRRTASVAVAKDLAARIADEWQVVVPVVVKSAREFDAIVAECPFRAEALDASRVLVVFGQDATALQALEPLIALAEPGEFHLGERAAFLYCPDGILASRVADALLGKPGRGVTTRNWATTRKLQALLQS